MIKRELEVKKQELFWGSIKTSNIIMKYSELINSFNLKHKLVQGLSYPI